MSQALDLCLGRQGAGIHCGSSGGCGLCSVTTPSWTSDRMASGVAVPAWRSCPLRRRAMSLNVLALIGVQARHASLAALLLALAEKHVARRVVGHGFAQAGQHLDPTPHGRPCANFIEPALQVRIVGPVNALVLP